MTAIGTYVLSTIERALDFFNNIHIPEIVTAAPTVPVAARFGAGNLPESLYYYFHFILVEIINH